MDILQLQNAGFKYSGSERWVFRHFDLNIESGETIRIVGRNGIGKTTLLKVLSGLLDLTEGGLKIDSGLKVVYMDQFAGDMLARDLTISEQLKAIEVSDLPFVGNALTMLERFGLGLHSRTDEFVGYLSGGQRQIIALLCVLIGGANILCLDEFTSSMDEFSTQTAYQLLSDFQTSKKITLLLVGHGDFPNEIHREVGMNVV